MTRRAVGLYALYVGGSVLGAVVSANLDLATGFSPWYPPAGLAMAVLLLVGYRAVPLVFVTRLLGVAAADFDSLRDRPGTILVQAVVIVATYTVAAEVLRRIGLEKAHIREYGWFVTVAVVAAPLVAGLGVALVEWARTGVSAADALDASRTFWVGDAATIATFVPCILILARAVSVGPIADRRALGRGSQVEAVVQAVALVLVPVLVFAVGRHNHAHPILVLAVLPAVWVAARRDLVVASFGPVVVNTTVAVMAGWLDPVDTSLVELQIVMLSASLAAGYVAVALRTRSDLEVAEAQQSGKYEALLGGTADLVARFDRTGALLSANRDGVGEIVNHIAELWAGSASTAWDAPRPEQHDWTLDRDGVTEWYRTRVGVERGIDGEPLTLLSVTTDLTALRTMEQQVVESMARDSLTGLASAGAILEFCDQRSASAAESDRLAIAVVDLDRFAQVRQATQEGADELLRLVGHFLARTSPPRALVGRTGDQEFTVASVFPAATAADDMAAVAAELLEVIHGADRRGRSTVLTASIGVATASDASVPARQLMADARLAVGAAKELGRDRVVVFDHEFRRAAIDRRRLLDGIRRALDDGEFRVLYQPEVSLVDRRIVGVEALVRWHRPGHGVLPPAEFLDLAERNGLIAELGAQVLDEALGQLARWEAEGLDLTVGVNVSAQQLVSDEFATTLDDAIRRHGVAPRHVRVELTETSLLVDPPLAARTLAALRELGAQLALDDFGAGYASIGYLRTLPLDVLKIDQSFVAGLPHAEDDQAIVRFVIGLAESLGLEVTAEGIEHQEQADCLVELGCLRGQGYLFDRAVPADHIFANLARPVS